MNENEIGHKLKNYYTMLITKIRLSNFKNFGDTEVNLGKMNVIVGANAAGKSNFIQTLSFIRDIRNFGIENAISLKGGMGYLRNLYVKGNKPVRVELHFDTDNQMYIQYLFDGQVCVFQLIKAYSIEFITNEATGYEVITESITFHSILKKDLLTDKIGEFESTILVKKGQFTFKTDFNKNLLLSIKKNAGIETNLDGNINESLYLPFEAIKIIMPSEATHKRKTILEVFPGILPSPLFSFAIYDFDLKKAKQSSPITGKVELEENGENVAIVLKNILEDKEKTRQFTNLLSDILPFVKQMGIDKFYDNSLLFKVKEIYQQANPIPSSLLSDGTIAMTLMVVALFFEQKNLAIFEEPEQGIHPALIAKLMEYFYEASHKKQMIITTHNAEVLKHTKLADLYLISRNEKGVASINKPAEQEMVQAFLQNELGIDQLFTQNLLDI